METAVRSGQLRRSIFDFQSRRHGWESDPKIDFFRQTLVIEDYPNRMPLIEQLCAGKSVLHVGCVDWPIFHPNTNLHLKLANVAAKLVGVDRDRPGLDTLRAHYDGEYYTNVADVHEPFDVLLVPEVIEHVPNVGEFLEELDTVDFNTVLVTGPNAIYRSPCPWWNATYRDGERIVEFVHPDHKCYFSPYTLSNAIASSTPWDVKRIGLTTEQTAVFVVATKKKAA